jgi:hypothetical protein
MEHARQEGNLQPIQMLQRARWLYTRPGGYLDTSEQLEHPGQHKNANEDNQREVVKDHSGKWVTLRMWPADIRTRNQE